MSVVAQLPEKKRRLQVISDSQNLPSGEPALCFLEAFSDRAVPTAEEEPNVEEVERTVYEEVPHVSMCIWNLQKGEIEVDVPELRAIIKRARSAIAHLKKRRRYEVVKKYF